MNLFELSDLLSTTGARFEVVDHEDGLTYLVFVPFERWEIELQGGRVVRVERFISTRDRLSPTDLKDMVKRIGNF